MIDLYYFDPSEFWRYDGGRQVNWFARMSPRLLFSIDLLRYRWSTYRGASMPIDISPHDDAIGRHLGQSDALSDHDVDRWGEVRGIDVMPRGIETAEHVEAFRLLATDAGLTAIGFYPHWSRPGLHLGVRAGRKLGDPALWGAVSINGKQTYTSYSAALEAFA